MHAFDVFFLVIAVVLVSIGVWHGMVAELFRLLAIAGAFLSAAWFHRALAGRLTMLGGNTTIKSVVAFMVIFLAVLALVLLIGWGVRKAVQMTPLGIVDRLGGGVLGLLKTAVLAWMVCTLVGLLPSSRIQAAVDTSRTYLLFRHSALNSLIPSLSPGAKKIEKAIDPSLLKKLKDVGNSLEEFDRKVDSAKNNTR